MEIIQTANSVLPIVSVIVSIISGYVYYRLAIQEIQFKIREMSDKIKESEQVIQELRTYTDARFLSEVSPLLTRIHNLELGMAKLGEQLTGGFAKMDVNMEYIKDFMRRLSEK